MFTKTHFCLAMATVSLFVAASVPAGADSRVRIVRLSYIEGNVQIDRGAGYEKAMLNLPVTEGMGLRTSEDARAEVEFEDGNTMRLAPATDVKFSTLSLQDSGEKVSVAELGRGTVYFELQDAKHNRVTLRFGDESVTLTSAAHLRIGADETGSALAVLKGEIQIDAPSGPVMVKKGQTASFDSEENGRVTVAKEIQKEPYDSWDKEQSDYRVRYANNSYNSYSPYAYGTSDLAYYGNFLNVPGYGMCWQPYFVGMGWDPFMDGAWMSYPGWGYGWVSAYPWGWVPYHYGSWVFLAGYGWVWQPGGLWMPWYAQPRVVNPPSGFHVPQAPAAGGTTIVVNRGPSPVITTREGSKLVIRNNSAGLGISRGEIANLAKVSERVQQKGTVTQQITRESIQPDRARSDRELPGFGKADTSDKFGHSAGGHRESNRGGPPVEGSEPRMGPAPRSSSSGSAPPAPPPHK